MCPSAQCISISGSSSPELPRNYAMFKKKKKKESIVLPEYFIYPFFSRVPQTGMHALSWVQDPSATERGIGCQPHFTGVITEAPKVAVLMQREPAMPRAREARTGFALSQCRGLYGLLRRYLPTLHCF